MVEIEVPAAMTGASCALRAEESTAHDFLVAASPAGETRFGPRGSCQVLGAVLPQGARYVGYRYEAEDLRTVGDCLADQECPVGQALWRGHPAVARAGPATAVAAVFENRAAAPRRARLWLYFAAGR